MSRESIISINEERNGTLGKSEITELDRHLNKYNIEGPKTSSFSDIYPEKDIERNDAEVLRLQAIFDQEPDSAKERNRYSQALEMILVEFASSWLPGFLSRASKYDDFINGIDLVLELSDSSGHTHRLGIDVTSSPQKVALKLDDTIKRTRKGLPHQMKYFESELDERRGHIELSRVVLGTNDLAVVSQLVRLFLQYKNAVVSIERIRIRKLIESHPVGKEIAKELEMQLCSFLEIAPNGDLQEILSALIEFQKEKAVTNQQDSAGDDRSNGVLEAISVALR